MQVENGVRFELRLLEEKGDGARFQLSVRVPGQEFIGEAEIEGSSGGVRFEFSDAREPPEWCSSAVRASLRTLFRERAARGGYPTRVARWRPEPNAPGGDSP